jgi:hypothetical protein
MTAGRVVSQLFFIHMASCMTRGRNGAATSSVYGGSGYGGTKLLWMGCSAVIGTIPEGVGGASSLLVVRHVYG